MRSARRPPRDVVLAFVADEEAGGVFGASHLVEHRPDLFEGDFAILGEPSNGQVEGGCNGTLRFELRTRGVRAHSARAWVGDNAIHRAIAALAPLADLPVRDVSVDGSTSALANPASRTAASVSSSTASTSARSTSTRARSPRSRTRTLRA